MGRGPRWSQSEDIALVKACKKVSEGPVTEKSTAIFWSSVAEIFVENHTARSPQSLKNRWQKLSKEVDNIISGGPNAEKMNKLDTIDECKLEATMEESSSPQQKVIESEQNSFLSTNSIAVTEPMESTDDSSDAGTEKESLSIPRLENEKTDKRAKYDTSAEMTNSILQNILEISTGIQQIYKEEIARKTDAMNRKNEAMKRKNEILEEDATTRLFMLDKDSDESKEYFALLRLKKLRRLRMEVLRVNNQGIEK